MSYAIAKMLNPQLSVNNSGKDPMLKRQDAVKRRMMAKQ